MEKRVCKNGDLKLTVLGLGCWAFGGSSDDYWGERDQQDVDNIVHAAIDQGINYFDTAEMYNGGRSEASLGKVLKDIPRDRVIIGSKVSPSNCYPDILVKHCEASLKRLGTDYIDLYMIHWPIHSYSMWNFTNDESIVNNPPDTVEAYETLLKLKLQGKIKHIGISNYGVPRLKELPELDKIAVNQLPYNLLCRAIEYDALDYCQQNGIGVMAYMGLMQGVLADKFKTIDDIPPIRRRLRHFDAKRTKACRHGEDGCEQETNQALQDIRNICKETGIPMAQLAIKWMVANQDITCTLVGASSLKQLQENIEAVREPLPAEIVAALNKVTLPVKEALGNHIDYFESEENDRTK